MDANGQGTLHGAAGPATQHDPAAMGLTPTLAEDDAAHQQDKRNDGDKESGN